jgi:hypothetical protein
MLDMANQRFCLIRHFIDDSSKPPTMKHQFKHKAGKLVAGVYLLKVKCASQESILKIMAE